MEASFHKFRDMKLRTKLNLYLFMVVLVSCFFIGGISYMSVRRALIDHSEESVVSFMKQIGGRLDEKIQEFQDATYSLVNRKEIQAILEKEEIESNTFYHALNEADFKEGLFLYNVLYQNSDFVIMESEDGQIYSYNQIGTPALDAEYEKTLVETFRSEVSTVSPVKWLKRDGQVYFLRRIISLDARNKARASGLIIFALQNDFFECGDDDNPFVSSDKIMVADPKGMVYGEYKYGLADEDLTYYLNYREGSYYVYSTVADILGERCLVIPLHTKKFRWNAICMLPYSLILERADSIIPKVAVAMCVLLCAGLLFANAIWATIRKNLDIIESGMKQYETGNYIQLEAPACRDEIGQIIEQFSHMGLKIAELNEISRAEQELSQNLKYQVMETQINPHFLYNTLGTLKWMAYEKEQNEIAGLADAMISLLRFTVKKANTVIRFGEETDYVQQYIYIQKVRYEDAFQVEFHVSEEAKEFPVIGFILQPFVENSILHGLDSSRKDGRIVITGKVANRKLLVRVEDNGQGMPEEKLAELLRRMERNEIEEYKGFNGIGMINIILRLRLIYGNEFQYKVESAAGKGTAVTLVFPEKVNNDEKEGTGR